jgi:hypothetical protein
VRRRFVGIVGPGVATSAVGVGIAVASAAEGVNAREGEAGTVPSGDASEDGEGLRRAPVHPMVKAAISPMMAMIRIRPPVKLLSAGIPDRRTLTIVAL